jgi:hypothetical protein
MSQQIIGDCREFRRSRASLSRYSAFPDLQSTNEQERSYLIVTVLFCNLIISVLIIILVTIVTLLHMNTIRSKIASSLLASKTPRLLHI